jgi:hypothetical protein
MHTSVICAVNEPEVRVGVRKPLVRFKVITAVSGPGVLSEHG